MLKKVLPNLLVISSILCLVVFLVIWNVRQYEQAESSLKKELSFHLESATNEVHQKQFSSFMKRLDIKVPSDSTSSFFSSNKVDTATRIVVWVDSLSVKEKSNFRFEKDSKWLRKDSVSKGLGNARLKTIFKKNAEDSGSFKFPSKINGGDFFTLVNSNKTDKELEKALQLFTDKLKENDLPTDFAQQKDSIVSTSVTMPIEYEAPSMLSGQRILYFYNYTNYLFRKIAPSIAFSICLLTLVIIAFVVVMKSLREQQKMVNIKNDFISNMTHELKTPISTVSVAIEAIRKYDVIKDKQKTEEYLDISSNELGRLSLLVEKVLRTTLFESGKGFLNPQPVDLSVIVGETLRTMQMHFEERRVALSTDLFDGPLWVMGDKVHLTNVVYNLIENAVKYSKEDIQIRVITRQTANGVSLSVSDNGIGIPAEHQKQIFTKFYRVPNHDRHNVKGHGLGLSYVKQVIDELGGRIELKSQHGEGASFCIHLKSAKA